jgi:hypothetical protein
MNFYRPARCVPIHSGNITRWIVKAHQPVHLFDRSKSAIDIVWRSLACDIDERAEQWAAAPTFSARAQSHKMATGASHRQ